MLTIKTAESIYTPEWSRSQIGLTHALLLVMTPSVASKYSTEWQD
jgi:hypothetical protein